MYDNVPKQKTVMPTKFYGVTNQTLVHGNIYLCITEFLNLIIHDCEFYEQLQNLRYRSTHSCTKI